MTGTFWKSLGLTSFVLALAGCGSGGVQEWDRVTSARYSSLQKSPNLLGVTVPVLRSHGLERVWGQPEIELDGKGGYMLNYRDPKQPFTRLVVHGMTGPLPKLSSPPPVSGEEMVNDQLTGYRRPQGWREVMIAGQKVRWFQQSASGGADGAYFSTEGFTLKSPDGRTGHYFLVAETGDDAAGVARWFGSVSF